MSFRPLKTAFLVGSLSACLLTQACGVQTTSGAAYIDRYEAVASKHGATKEMEKFVKDAADIEPILQFPARFGLARIANGRLTNIPLEEQHLWKGLAAKWEEIGQFMPISPLIAAAAVGPRQCQSRYYCGQSTAELLKTIRAGAARQHVHAVLIYEVGARSSNKSSRLGFMDITIIGGAFLPTRSMKAAGVAQALLMDVRNGYPYGQASAFHSMEELTASWGSDARTLEFRQKVALKTVAALIPVLDEMLRDLVVQMLALKSKTTDLPGAKRS